MGEGLQVSSLKVEGCRNYLLPITYYLFPIPNARCPIVTKLQMLRSYCPRLGSTEC